MKYDPNCTFPRERERLYYIHVTEPGEDKQNSQTRATEQLKPTTAPRKRKKKKKKEQTNARKAPAGPN